MKKKIFVSFIVAAVMASSVAVFGWGVWGHNHINKGAVLSLPAEMGMFFYNHCDFIVEESTVPDIRKHLMNDKAESSRHYIDLESYSYTGRAAMPRTMAEAIEKYSKDTLERHGLLPWQIQDMMVKLTDAMKNKRKTEILLLAADLGHYVADAHMPLHTSLNHNGQLTGQVGIHAFWESQLPELFGKNYHLYTGSAHYVNDIEKATWDIIDSSHRLVDTLLRIEFKMRKDNPEDKQYAMGADGKPLKNKYGNPVHAYEYAHVYHELLNGMVERQMKSAIADVADFWYTAWVNAGKPDLDELDPASMTDRNKAQYKEDLKAWKTGKIKGLRSDKEF
jgi:hypothetical protein